jgi:hypothetical protein
MTALAILPTTRFRNAIVKKVVVCKQVKSCGSKCFIAPGAMPAQFLVFFLSRTFFAEMPPPSRIAISVTGAFKNTGAPTTPFPKILAQWSRAAG